MARITRVKCDGCKATLQPSEPWRYLQVSGYEDGQLEICVACWNKMLDAVGLNRTPKSGEGNEDEYGNVTEYK